MGLTEKLTEIKSQTDALLAYANSQTGKDDPELGEAIRSLVEGMGSGGSDPTVPQGITVGVFVPDEDVKEFNIPVPDGTTTVSGVLVGTTDIGIGSISDQNRIWNACMINYADGQRYNAPLTCIKPDGTRDYFTNRVNVELTTGNARVWLAVGTGTFFGNGLRYIYALIYA